MEYLYAVENRHHQMSWLHLWDMRGFRQSVCELCILEIMLGVVSNNSSENDYLWKSLIQSILELQDILTRDFIAEKLVKNVFLLPSEIIQFIKVQSATHKILESVLNKFQLHRKVDLGFLFCFPLFFLPPCLSVWNMWAHILPSCTWGGLLWGWRDLQLFWAWGLERRLLSANETSSLCSLTFIMQQSWNMQKISSRHRYRTQQLTQVSGPGLLRGSTVYNSKTHPGERT